jgi:glycosyltransferase involved in cell wall biosynthesis
VFPQSTNRIIGDHLEALSETILRLGPRGGFAEGIRNREIMRYYVPPKSAGKARRSAVIPVKEESNTIQQVIRSVRAAQVDEIIVVANGADETTIRMAMETGARVMVFNLPLGHNVGRAIGAACSTGDVCLFVDGDFVVPPEDLLPYIEAVENGIEVALNDLQSLFYRFIPVDPISAVKYFLNICLNQSGLLNNSLTAVPHALSRKALNIIGFEKLVIPPLAQAKAILSGLSLKPVHAVDVVTPNRIRKDHIHVNGRIPAFDRIIGDHLEAVDYLLRMKGTRGGFYDTSRNHQVMTTLERKRFH